MVLGQVVGTVWGSKQVAALRGLRIVEVWPVSFRDVPSGACLRGDFGPTGLEGTALLAVDPLGADIGQLVLVAIGSRVRDIVVGKEVTTKHCVVAIVDEVEVDEKGGLRVWEKGGKEAGGR